MLGRDLGPYRVLAPLGWRSSPGAAVLIVVAALAISLPARRAMNQDRITLRAE
jgi:hypothetical protein